jgi:FlaA1/EpsC-like NDP-sugar epimerase
VRYFMTIEEAARLVVQAAELSSGEGEIFVLDMGEPVRVEKLARELITLSGYRPEVDIPITVTGNRGGEKLSEELFTASEGTVTTRFAKIFITRPEVIDVLENRGRFDLETKIRDFQARLRGAGMAAEARTILVGFLKELAAAAGIVDGDPPN